MRPSRLLVVLMFAAALAGCALAPAAPVAGDAVPAPGDLDGMAYGRFGPRAVTAVPLPPPPIPAAVPLPAGAPVAVPVQAAIAAPAMPPSPVAAVAPMPEMLPVLLPGNEPYLLDSGDRLRITVYGQEGLSNGYIVDANGRITVPLIGPVIARGCTTTQLANVIADRLRQGFIREPSVSIEIELYRPFFILGEVLAPGQYPYVPNMTVETAVAIAGGYTPRAYRYNAEVSRSANGLTARQKVPSIAPVRPGDTITISERWF